MVLLIALVCVGCDERILHSLTETDANRMLTQLYAQGIEAKKEQQPDGSWALSVSASRVPQALNALQDARLLPNVDRGTKESSSLVPTRADERLRLERSLSSAIESTLASIPGVLEARVHLNLPPTDPLFGTPLKGAQGSASVLAVLDEGIVLEGQQLAALVSGASGVEAERVAVMFTTRAQRIVPATAVPAPTAQPPPWQSSPAWLAALAIALGVGLMLLAKKLRPREQRTRVLVESV